MFISDFTKDPHEIIVDLINNDNGTTLAANILSFSSPTATVSGSTRNTSVTISGTPTSGYVNNVDMQYDRINLAVISNYFSSTVNVTSPTHVSDLIPAINAQFKVNLTTDDYVNDVLGNPDSNGQIQVTIQAASQSLVYYGSLALTVQT